MIRHTSSFFISLLIHTLLILTLFFTWKNHSAFKSEESNEIVCVKLCDVVDSTKAIKPKQTKIEKPEIKKLEKVLKKAEPKKVEVVVKKEIAIPVETIQVSEIEKEIVKEAVEQEKTPKVVVVEESSTEPVKESVIEQEEEKKEAKQAYSKEYLQINTQKIAQLLQENLYYPRSARKRNITGQIVVKFTLGVDAKVYDIEVIESNSEVLSRAAIQTINDLSGKFPKPQEELTLQVPIVYSLK